MLNHPRVSPSDNVLRADITPRGRLASYSSNGGYCNNAATVHVWPRSALSYGQESPPRPTRGEGNVSASAGSSIQEVYKAPNRNSNSNSNIPQIKYCRQRQHLQRRIFDEAKGGNFLRFDRLLTEAQTIITAQEGEDAGKEAVNFPYSAKVIVEDGSTLWPWYWCIDISDAPGDCWQAPPGVEPETGDTLLVITLKNGMEEHALRLIRYPSIDFHARNLSGRGAAAIASIHGYYGANAFDALLPRNVRIALWSRKRRARASRKKTRRHTLDNRGKRSGVASYPLLWSSPSKCCYEAGKLSINTCFHSERKLSSRPRKLRTAGVGPAAVAAADGSTHQPVLEGGKNRENWKVRERQGHSLAQQTMALEPSRLKNTGGMFGDTSVSTNLAVGGNCKQHILAPLSTIVLPVCDNVVAVSVAVQTDMIPAFNPPQPQYIEGVNFLEQVSARASQEGTVREHDTTQHQLTRVSGAAVFTPVRQDPETNQPSIVPAVVAAPGELDYPLKSDPKPATVITGSTALIDLQDKEFIVGGGVTEEADLDRDRLEGHVKNEGIGNPDGVITDVSEPLTVEARNCDRTASAASTGNATSTTCALVNPEVCDTEVGADITRHICSETGALREENVQSPEGSDAEWLSVPGGGVEDAAVVEFWTRVDDVAKEMQGLLLEDALQKDGTFDYRATFELFDIDGDGAVTTGELSSIFVSLGMGNLLPEEGITAIMERVPRDAEGRISQREIQAFAERPADLPWPPSKHPNTLFTHGAPSAAATTTLALELHEIQVKDELTTGMFSWKKDRKDHSGVSLFVRITFGRSVVNSTVAVAESLPLCSVVNHETAQSSGREDCAIWTWRWDQMFKIAVPLPTELTAGEVSFEDVPVLGDSDGYCNSKATSDDEGGGDVPARSKSVRFWSPERIRGKWNSGEATSEKDYVKETAIGRDLNGDDDNCYSQAESITSFSLESCSPVDPAGGEVSHDKIGWTKRDTRQQGELTVDQLVLEVWEVPAVSAHFPTPVVGDSAARPSSSSPGKKTLLQDKIGIKKRQDDSARRISSQLSISEDGTWSRLGSTMELAIGALNDEVSIVPTVEKIFELPNEDCADVQEEGYNSEPVDEPASPTSKEPSSPPWLSNGNTGLFSVLTKSRRTVEISSEAGCRRSLECDDIATGNENHRREKYFPWFHTGQNGGQDIFKSATTNVTRQSETATLWGSVCVPIKELLMRDTDSEPEETPTPTTSTATVRDTRDKTAFRGLFSPRGGADNQRKKSILPGNLVETIASYTGKRRNKIVGAVNDNIDPEEAMNDQSMQEDKGDGDGGASASVCQEDNMLTKWLGRRVIIDDAWFEINGPKKGKKTKRKGRIRLSLSGTARSF